MTPLPVIIAQVPSQQFHVQRLITYCQALDGTKPIVLPVSDEGFVPRYPANALACLQASSFHKAAKHMAGRAFIWLEADSIPLIKGWSTMLTEEYSRLGAPFMLPPLAHSIHDVASGIGVYGPDSHWLIPQHFATRSWDYWLLDHLRPVVSHTRLLQHSYGVYNSNGTVAPHRFPRDNHILRPEAVLFHKDAHQDLIPGGTTKFTHTGDLGDIIACLPVIRQLGGGTLTIAAHNDKQREIITLERYEIIRPLLEKVSFLSGVNHTTELPTDKDYHHMGTFRTLHGRGDNLSVHQGRALGVAPLDQSPWLSVSPDPRYAGRVVVSRSARYHTQGFPWRQIASRYKSKLLFIGLPDEHLAFQDMTGSRVERASTENLLEVAEIIAASRLFIGNQSCPFWIAAAMGVRLIQETWPTEPNSMVPRENARYTLTTDDLNAVRRQLLSR